MIGFALLNWLTYLLLFLFPSDPGVCCCHDGSGKSSVVQLIERFYDPTEGSVEYFGIDLKDINVRWLRNEIGLVSQEATLFNTTILENIRFGCPDKTKDEVEEAAKQANCHEFIMSFPNRYQTVIGEGGSLVSGGQKQVRR